MGPLRPPDVELLRKGLRMSRSPEVQRLEAEVRLLEQRLMQVENSMVFRTLKWIGATASDLRRRFTGTPLAPSYGLWYRELQSIMPPAPPVAVPPGYALLREPGDELLPGAEALFAETAQRTGADIVYADEERGGEPAFKPAWSPELFAETPYLGSTRLVRRGFENTPPGARVAHVPRVLYRSETPMLVRDAPTPASSTPVTIIICSRDAALLSACIESLRSTSHSAFDILVVEHHLDHPLPPRARVIPYDGPFHWSRMNNLAARQAKGEILVFLNDDVTVLAPEWLSWMAWHAARDGVGAVGAKLVYPNGSIQHAGVALGMMGGCGHPGRGQFNTPWMFTDVTRNVSAVTGACLAVRRDTFERLGGFSEDFPVNYNDIDFCLRLGEAGLRVVYEPRALLRHDECRTRVRGAVIAERGRFHERWAAKLEVPDPFYPIYFRRDSEQIAPRPVLEVEPMLRGG